MSESTIKSIEIIANILSIATPVILLIWFLYMSWQQNSKNLYDEVRGDYAGLISSEETSDGISPTYGGIILRIVNINSDGYFKGEFDFGESKDLKILSDGNYVFIGKVNYCFYINRIRVPFVKKENRVYRGKLYVVERLDTPAGQINQEELSNFEYDFTYYREIQQIQLDKLVIKSTVNQNIPSQILLSKKLDIMFEPYGIVKQLCFEQSKF